MVMLAAVVIVNEEGLMEAWWRCRCVGVGVGVGVAWCGGGGRWRFIGILMDVQPSPQKEGDSF
jgi:hypothetical protein